MKTNFTPVIFGKKCLARDELKMGRRRAKCLHQDGPSGGPDLGNARKKLALHCIELQKNIPIYYGEITPNSQPKNIRVENYA